MRRAVLLLVAACSGSDDSDRTVTVTPPPPQATVVAPVDAALSDGSTFLPDTDPTMHLDEDDDTAAAEPVTPRARSRRLLEILLRSTPAGATAYVDGRPVGVTPTYWEGEFTGRARDFTFVLPGYFARYKFVPIQNGIVHARLSPVLSVGAVPPIPPPPSPEQPAPTPKPRPSTSATADAAPAPDDAAEPAPVDALPVDDAGN